MQPRAAARVRLSGARRTATTFELGAARLYDFSSQPHHTWGADSNQAPAVVPLSVPNGQIKQNRQPNSN